MNVNGKTIYMLYVNKRTKLSKVERRDRTRHKKKESEKKHKILFQTKLKNELNVYRNTLSYTKWMYVEIKRGKKRTTNPRVCVVNVNTGLNKFRTKTNLHSYGVFFCLFEFKIPFFEFVSCRSFIFSVCAKKYFELCGEYGV